MHEEILFYIPMYLDYILLFNTFFIQFFHSDLIILSNPEVNFIQAIQQDRDRLIYIHHNLIVDPFFLLSILFQWNLFRIFLASFKK